MVDVVKQYPLYDCLFFYTEAATCLWTTGGFSAMMFATSAHKSMEKVAEHDTKKPVHGRSGDTVYGIAALLSGGTLSLYLPRKRLSRLAKASVFLPGRAKLTD